MSDQLDIVEDIVRFSYIIAALLAVMAFLLVGAAWWALSEEKLSGEQFIEFVRLMVSATGYTGIVVAGFGIVGITNAVANVARARANKDAQP